MVTDERPSEGMNTDEENRAPQAHNEAYLCSSVLVRVHL